MGTFWKPLCYIAVAAGAAYLIYWWQNTTKVCTPYRTSEGYLEAVCVRYQNDMAQFVLDTERGAFISNPDDWRRIREYNDRIWEQRKGSRKAN